MGFKVKITLLLFSNEEEISYEFREKFIRNYSFTMMYLEELLEQGNEDLKPFFNFFKNTLGCDDEIFSLFNEKPRTQNKQHFIFELEFPIKEDRQDLIVLNTRRTFDPYVDLKFKKKIYF